MSWRQCPECGSPITNCIDSRAGKDYVNRRYKCGRNHRWSTLEQLATAPDPDNRMLEFRGKQRTVRGWAKMLRITPATLRLRLGTMPLEEALAKPKGMRGKLRVIAE